MASLHSIWIQHGNQFEDVLSPQLFGTLVVLSQNEVEKPVEDETRGSLPGMDSAADEVNLLSKISQLTNLIRQR